MAGDLIIGCVAFCICALTVGFTGLTVAAVGSMALDVLSDVKSKAHTLFCKK